MLKAEMLDELYRNFINEAVDAYVDAENARWRAGETAVTTRDTRISNVHHFRRYIHAQLDRLKVA